MADAGLFIGWGQVVRGREGQALDVFNQSVEFYGQLQQDGRIESFEVCLLDPHGGDLAGFMLLRGSVEQVNALREDDEFLRTTQRADLIVENLGVVRASLGEGIGRIMSIYQEEIGAFV
jgi:hypothetical protein